MSGRIVDADVDAVANIARLTGQVARMKDDVSHYRQYIDELKEDIRKSDAQRDELQRLLTACEEERDDYQRIVEVWQKRYEGSQDLVRVLGPENAHLKRECGRLHAAGAALFETYRHGMTRDEQWRHLEALTIHVSATPTAETPAPTYQVCVICGRESEAPFVFCPRCGECNPAPPAETPAPADFRDVVTLSDDSFAVDPVLAKSVVNEVQRIAAETLAPTAFEVCKHCGQHHPTGMVVHRDHNGDWCDKEIARLRSYEGRWKTQLDLSAKLDGENDRLRADLYAANERIAINEKLLATRDDLLAMFDCPEHGTCVPHAKEEVTRLRAKVAATKAQLGRAVGALRGAKPYVNGASSYIGESRRVATEIESILADADSKVTP